MLVALAAVPSSVPHSVHLGARVVHTPPRSRVHSLLTNGSSIPAGGAVWPTAIYWSTVSVGTPPQKFPVAIDSGSGDLDISAKDCAGCVTTPPNNQYDASASSTSSSAFPFIFSNSYQTCDLKVAAEPAHPRARWLNLSKTLTLSRPRATRTRRRPARSAAVCTRIRSRSRGWDPSRSSLGPSRSRRAISTSSRRSTA